MPLSQDKPTIVIHSEKKIAILKKECTTALYNQVGFWFSLNFLSHVFSIVVVQKVKKNNDLNFEIRMLMISVYREYKNFIVSNFQEDKICVGDSEDCW